ncbi:MAG: hypothetical protein ACKPKO_20090, partial [Candidatus Fonsibacter sp.]
VVHVMLPAHTFPTVTLVKDVNVFCLSGHCKLDGVGYGLIGVGGVIDVPQTDHCLSNASDGTSERGVVLGSFFVKINI